MVIAPQGTIKLLKTPFDDKYEHTLLFSNLTAQLSYFNLLPSYTYEDVTYSRADETLYVNVKYDDAIKYDYVMYQNEGYSEKWFFAFIESYNYENNEVTSLKIKTDVFQTWMFDYDIYPSFVEREHVSDDTIGKHTYPENLETGDYVSCALQPSFYDEPETCFVVACTEQVTQGYSITGNTKMPDALYYYGISSLEGVRDFIRVISTEYKPETIYAVFIAYKSFFTSWTSMTGVTGEVSSSLVYQYHNTINVTKVNYLGKNYVPKNNKLYCFPYSFLQVSNHAGQIMTYKWENFNNILTEQTNIQFRIDGVISPGCSIKCFPIDYNNIISNFDDCINVGKLPVGSFTTDVFTNWLTFNCMNIGMNSAFSLLDITEGSISLSEGNTGGLGQIESGFKGIINSLSSVYQHSLLPDTISGNTNAGDINYMLGLQNLEFKRMSIKDEYAKIIDEYFYKYGYKVNEIKIPNLFSRTNWNYIKTIGIVINPKTGHDILNHDLDEIKSIYNNGITLWHNPTTMFDYSQSNNII